MTRVWRVCRRAYIQTAFSGDGTKKAAGRWTPAGVSAVYTSQSLSLAILELLVNMDRRQIGDMVGIPADLPEDLPMTVIEPRALPARWRHTPAPLALRDYGQRWLEEGKTAALKVPSAVVPVEFNYLLNPTHPEFSRIVIGSPARLAFDERL